VNRGQLAQRLHCWLVARALFANDLKEDLRD